MWQLGEGGEGQCQRIVYCCGIIYYSTSVSAYMVNKHCRTRQDQTAIKSGATSVAYFSQQIQRVNSLELWVIHDERSYVLRTRGKALTRYTHLFFILFFSNKEIRSGYRRATHSKKRKFTHSLFMYFRPPSIKTFTKNSCWHLFWQAHFSNPRVVWPMID